MTRVFEKVKKQATAGNRFANRRSGGIGFLHCGLPCQITKRAMPTCPVISPAMTPPSDQGFIVPPETIAQRMATLDATIKAAPTQSMLRIHRMKLLSSPGTSTYLVRPPSFAQHRLAIARNSDGCIAMVTRETEPPYIYLLQPPIPEYPRNQLPRDLWLPRDKGLATKWLPRDNGLATKWLPRNNGLAIKSHLLGSYSDIKGLCFAVP
ncbi:hypothetical protein F5B20DRAFT_67505 [Whalleya microplaca]|nr:hypothetical protein F5B20DRAFT_67505 [Whalleya microplaca]